MTEAVAARPFSAAANRHGEGWALAAICALAVALRLVLLRLYPGILHPDEVFQYLEQANRVVHGSGLVPWEYAVGLRNWLAPGLVAGAMAVGGLLGVHLLLCALSLGPVVCGFWWGRRHAGLAGAVTVGLLNAAWFQTVYFSSHVLSETLATAPLYVGLFLADQGGRTRWRPFWAGMLLGLAVVLRLQLAPVVAAAVLLVWWRGRGAGWQAMLAGLVAPVLLGGGLDAITWGMPFQSFGLNVYYNVVVGVAAHFSVNPPLYYLGLEWFAWGPFGLLIALCALRGGRALPLPLLAAVMIFVVHSLIGHKEERFVSAALPLIFTAAGLGSVLWANRLGARWWAAVPVGWLVASAVLAAAPSARIYWEHGRGSIAAMQLINADPHTCGVAVSPPESWSATGGYTYLRPGLALFEGPAEASTAVEAGYNAIIDHAGADFTAAGYRRARCWDDPLNRSGDVRHICVWQRPGLCVANAGVPLRATMDPFVAAAIRSARK